MDFRQIQDLLRTVRSGEIQKILATVLAIITAIGGIVLTGPGAGSSGGNGNGGSYTAPENANPSGVPLTNLQRYSSATAGQVEIDGKRYENALSYGSRTSESYDLDSRYSVLTVTVINTQKPAGRADFYIKGYRYRFDEDTTSQTLRINVANVDILRTKADGGKFVMVDAVVR